MPRLPEPLSRVRSIVSTGATTLVAQYRPLGLLRDRRLAVLAVANVLDTMSTTIFVPFLPSLADELGASPFVIGLIFSLPAVVGAVTNVPAGYVSDRWGRRPIISAGVTLSAIPVMAIASVGSPLVLIGLRCSDALLRAFVSPATTAYLGDTYDTDKRGSVFGAYHTTAMIGAAAGPAVGGAIAEVWGIRLPFLVLGSGTLVGGFVLLAYLPPIDDGINTTDRDRGSQFPQLTSDNVGQFLSVPAIGFLVTVFIDEFGTTALNPSFPLLLRETVGRGPAYVGTTYSALALAMLVFMPVGGRFADQIGRVRVLVATNVGWCLVMVGLALATSPLIPPALMFLGGVLSAFAAPALLAIQYEIAPDGREATFSGIAGTAESAGQVIGPLFAGAIIGWWGVRVAVIGAGFSWLLAIPLLALVRNRDRNQRRE